jgi:hypothetical protein
MNESEAEEQLFLRLRVEPLQIYIQVTRFLYFVIVFLSSMMILFKIYTITTHNFNCPLRQALVWPCCLIA